MKWFGNIPSHPLGALKRYLWNNDGPGELLGILRFLPGLRLRELQPKDQPKCGRVVSFRLETYLLFIVVFLFLASMKGFSQLKLERDRVFPQEYRRMVEQPFARVATTTGDTLNYRTLQKIKPDFVVNQGCGAYGADQQLINIARDDSGGYLCVWLDERTGLREVNAQLFGRGDERIGDVIRVSERYNGWNSDPHIVYNRAVREYIITWAESGYDIRFQRVLESGGMVGSSKVANQSFRLNTNNPSLAVDPLGNFIITWYTDQNALCRAFDKEGNAISDEWTLLGSLSNNVSSIGWDDRIASDSAGHFVVVWSSHVGNRSRIVIRPVSRNGNLGNEPIIVSDPGDSSDHYFPTVASTQDGHFLLLWSSHDDLCGRIYLSDSGFVSPQFTISEQKSTWFTYSASSDGVRNFYVVWSGVDHAAQVIRKQGVFDGRNRPLVFPTPLSSWFYPKLSRAIGGTLQLVYFGYRKNDVDVMIQKLDTSFQSIGLTAKVADDYCTEWHTNPVVKYNQSGKSLIVWEDKRNGTVLLYGQALDESGNSVGDNALICDTTTIQWASDAAITSDSDGNFVVSFLGGDYSSRAVTLQKISPFGARIGTNTRIATYYDSPLTTAIQRTSSGDLRLLWCIYYATYVQTVSSDLIPYQDRKVLLQSTLTPRYFKGFSINEHGEMFVTWVDYDVQSQQAGKALKGMTFDAQGLPSSDTLIIDTAASGWVHNNVDCRLDNDKNLLCAWSEYGLVSYGVTTNVFRRYRDDKTSYKDVISSGNYVSKPRIIRFENKKSLVSWDDGLYSKAVFLDDNLRSFTPIRLNAPSPVAWDGVHNSYSADIYGSRLQFTYEIARDPSRGFDVYANIQALGEIDFGQSSPAQELVSAVYPNPVSDHATLRYEIHAPRSVTVAVYNILGQKVYDVENRMRGPGVFEATVDVRALPSGVYFFRYNGAGSVTKKFLVIR